MNSNEISGNEHGATCSPEIDEISTKSTAKAQDGDVQCNDSEPNLKKAGRLKCNDTECNADPVAAKTNASKPDSNVRHNDISGVKKTINDIANSNISSDSCDSKKTDMITTDKSQDGSTSHNDIDSVNTNNCEFVKPSEESLCPEICAPDSSVIVDDVGDPDIGSTNANAGCDAKCNDTAASCDKGNDSSPLLAADDVKTCDNHSDKDTRDTTAVSCERGNNSLPLLAPEDAETCDNHNDKDTRDKTAVSCEKGNNSPPLLAAEDAEARDNHNDKDTRDKTAVSCEKGNNSPPLLAAEDAEARDNHNDKDTRDKTAVSCEKGNNSPPLLAVDDTETRDDHSDKSTTDTSVVEIASNPSEQNKATGDTPRTKTPSAKCANESTVAPPKEKQSSKPEPIEVIRNIAGQIIMPSLNIPEHR